MQFKFVNDIIGPVCRQATYLYNKYDAYIPLDSTQLKAVKAVLRSLLDTEYKEMVQGILDLIERDPFESTAISVSLMILLQSINKTYKYTAVSNFSDSASSLGKICKLLNPNYAIRPYDPGGKDVLCDLLDLLEDKYTINKEAM